jgi:hypothetical protein
MKDKLIKDFRKGVNDMGRLYLGKWDRQEVSGHSFSKIFAKGLGLSKAKQGGIVDYEWYLYKRFWKRKK